MNTNKEEVIPDIYLTDTSTGKKTKISYEKITKDKKVTRHLRMYSCGPTVYNFAHVGNFRTFLVSDLIARVFTYAGYKVTKVSNITDVGHLTNDDIADADGEDKMLKKAKEEGLTPFEIAKAYEQYFIEDEQSLNILPPTHRPRATEWIPQQIKMAQQLIEKEFAYESNGSVYFRVRKFEKYGELSGNSLDKLNAGQRVDVNTEKEDPLDFALWKRADEGHIMQWESPWGMGFPGWHIECSVMSTALLGNKIDLHTGGEDLIFPHHECEIAQNECSCDASVSHWVHVKHLLVNGEKMSKSKGNFYTIRDLMAEGWTGAEIRLALIKGHYRTAMNFSFDSLKEARANIRLFKRTYNKLKEYSRNGNSQVYLFYENNPVIERIGEPLVHKYMAHLFTDLGIMGALSVVIEIVRLANDLMYNDQLSQEGKDKIMHFFDNHFEPIFALGLAEIDEAETEVPNAVRVLLEQRKAARAAKEWSKSDALRDEISALGWMVKDEKDGMQSVTKAA